MEIEDTLNSNIAGGDNSEKWNQEAPQSGNEELDEKSIENPTDQNSPATQGIFAHSTSLEDSINDEVKSLDLLATSPNAGSDLVDVMKGSIHELQEDSLTQKEQDDLTQRSEER